MKYLLTILCLAVLASACSSSPSLTPSQQKVEAYLKKTLDDPASYQPARWGKESPIRRSDSLSYVAMARFASSDEDTRNSGLELTELAKKDTLTVVGTMLIHTFRAKNKLGGTVLDSARFVIGKTGAVAVLP